ncbi:hypothetical protein FHL15_010412 [Xylaria flabelliformis]|uniref:Uncharacterized protein n=1 Tax=Xylaria flabelliformis TaxID=2512241 RepID=A0A553HLA7_9PEZI|nr:hypothetical protein FHL15_010412 [Xylaria flabelliformis]
MTPFGQFNASAATFRTEATAALVNVNLEFNIFAKKFVQPPPEYAGVGQHLATSRLQEAQDGARHGVARRLGALFKDSAMLPSTPELIRTYGLRASEISRTATANPRGNDSHGAFAGMIGADATTLWAAATSGRPAIQCHLLACLLARIWEPPEATSIWVEIISRRKLILKSKLSEEGELEQEVLLAVASDISRSDLFDWDASARAWLRVGDHVMKKQQTQAKLIVDNLEMPVNSKPDMYDSVMDAWASSMKQMENLLRGIPLQAHCGDILLGLLSWHLYPDMKYLSRGQRTIEQNDPLLKGRGVLTLGLEPSPRVTKDPQSVYWALPLAHLRYYGRLPVTRIQSMRTTNRDRLTIDEMLWAMVSSYIQAWQDASVPMQAILQFVSNVAIEIHYSLGYDTYAANRIGKQSWLSEHIRPSNLSWLSMLSRICLQYKDRLLEERIRKLQALGRRFHRVSNPPFNGIFNVETYLAVCYSLESKIKLLREIASSKSSPSQMRVPKYYEFLIVSKRSDSICINNQKRDKTFGFFEFATVIPEFDECDGITRSHERWIITKHGANLSQEDIEIVNKRQLKIRMMKERINPFDPDRPAFVHHRRRKTRYHEIKSRGNVSIIKEYSLGARSYENMEEDAEFVSMQTYVGSKVVKDAGYVVVLGNLESVALLRRRDLPPLIHQSGKLDPPQNERRLNELTPRQILSLFQPGAVDFTKCVKGTHITDINLQAAALIESLYRNMGEASIDVRAVGVDFTKAKWVNSAVIQTQQKLGGKNMVSPQAVLTPYLHAKDIDTATCFACIAMMETGSYDLGPGGLRSVFGLCASDSLYITSCLLRDPADRLNMPPIQRYTGNIGRAGMALMVPPNEPEIRRYDLIDEWYQYDHNVYAGVMEDCFKGTSLHLSFSQASQAVNLNFSGGPDIEAYFLETLISVYSRAEWIAELDVLGSVTHPNLKSEAEILKGKTCSCKYPANKDPTIISIDNFAEMLVPPTQPGIIRAKGNWQARLAATALCLAKGYKVVIKEPNTCLACVIRMAEARSVNTSSAQEFKDVWMII